VGRRIVFHTKPPKDIKFGDRVGDKEVVYAFSGIWPFLVRDDKDGWLRMHDRRHEGWVDKADFVLAREAIDRAPHARGGVAPEKAARQRS
jgi:hypothetical protein